jgi:MFS family permease
MSRSSKHHSFEWQLLVLVSLALTATTSPPLFFIALHLQGRLGWSATATGLACLPLVGAVIAGAALAPRAIARRGTTVVMGGGLGLIASGMAVLIATPEGLLAALLPGQALYGAGLGAGSVAATAAGTAALGDGEQGLGSGLLTAAAQIGTAMGLAALVAVAGLASDPVDGMRAAFAVDAGFAGLASVALFARDFAACCTRALTERGVSGRCHSRTVVSRPTSGSPAGACASSPSRTRASSMDAGSRPAWWTRTST